MRLTLLTDYALRLLMYVGDRPERLCNIAEIAEAYCISKPHLNKVTHLLGQKGWINTIRGKGGGICLAHAPAAINLGEVVRSIEPDMALSECFSSGSICMLTGNCRLQVILGGALQAFLTHLDNHTLADLLNGGTVMPVKMMGADFSIATQATVDKVITGEKP